MDYRRIRGTDLDVSTVCFGPMRSAGADDSDPRSARGRDALSAALDAGINFVHSSYEYGVRWMMNEVLRDHPKRHDIHHVIKVPVPDWDDEGRFDPDKVRGMIDEALRDLAADRIALVQWMWRTRPHEDGPRQETLAAIRDDVAETFGRLRDEGKIGYVGVFPYTPASARASIDTGNFTSVIAYCNPLEMEMAELFGAMDQRDMSLLAIRPLYQGVLTDSRPSWEALPAGDRLKAEKHKDLFRHRAGMAEALAEAIEAEGSMTRFAMRFPLYAEAVASIIVGLNTPDQVHQVVEQTDNVPYKPDVVARALSYWQRSIDGGSSG